MTQFGDRRLDIVFLASLIGLTIELIVLIRIDRERRTEWTD